MREAKDEATPGVGDAPRLSTFDAAGSSQHRNTDALWEAHSAKEFGWVMVVEDEPGSVVEPPASPVRFNRREDATC